MACEVVHPISPDGQIDFRLQKTKRVSLEIDLTCQPAHATFEFADLKPGTSSVGVATTSSLTPDLTDGNALTPDLITHFPRTSSAGGFMLDLGCGRRNFAKVCERTNLEYIGIDHQGQAPDLLGDAHALPFRDNSFEFILSIAVLEHLRHPLIAMREAFRVLKPGGLFVGSVAFLEPFHMDSFYHHTHLGTHNSLVSAGFEVKQISPNTRWTGLRALTEMMLLTGMPRALTEISLFPLRMMNRLWWKWEDLRYKTNGDWDMWRRLSTTGGFRFVAAKPAETDSHAGPG